MIDKGSKLDPLTRLHVTTTANSGHDTLSVRIDTIKHSWDLIVQSPIIGHGLDQTTIANYYYPYVHAFYPAHDMRRPLLVRRRDLLAPRRVDDDGLVAQPLAAGAAQVLEGPP